MKSKDIVEEKNIPEDACDCCYLHEKAYEKLEDRITCPKCGEELQEGGAGCEGYVVVGEGNYYDENHKIGKYLVYNCEKCGGEYKSIYALMPIPIIYNGNHDIFYTGGKNYLTENTDKLNDKIKEKALSSIDQYTKRIKNGDRLSPQNLLWWIQADVQNAVAEFLYENGYKK